MPFDYDKYSTNFDNFCKKDDFEQNFKTKKETSATGEVARFLPHDISILFTETGKGRNKKIEIPQGSEEFIGKLKDLMGGITSIINSEVEEINKKKKKKINFHGMKIQEKTDSSKGLTNSEAIRFMSKIKDECKPKVTEIIQEIDKHFFPEGCEENIKKSIIFQSMKRIYQEAAFDLDDEEVIKYFKFGFLLGGIQDTTTDKLMDTNGQMQPIMSYMAESICKDIYKIDDNIHKKPKHIIRDALIRMQKEAGDKPITSEIALKEISAAHEKIQKAKGNTHPYPSKGMAELCIQIAELAENSSILGTAKNKIFATNTFRDLSSSISKDQSTANTVHKLIQSLKSEDLSKNIEKLRKEKAGKKSRTLEDYDKLLNLCNNYKELPTDDSLQKIMEEMERFKKSRSFAYNAKKYIKEKLGLGYSINSELHTIIKDFEPILRNQIPSKNSEFISSIKNDKAAQMSELDYLQFLLNVKAEGNKEVEKMVLSKSGGLQNINTLKKAVLSYQDKLGSGEDITDSKYVEIIKLSKVIESIINTKIAQIKEIADEVIKTLEFEPEASGLPPRSIEWLKLKKPVIQEVVNIALNQELIESSTIDHLDKTLNEIQKINSDLSEKIKPESIVDKQKAIKNVKNNLPKLNSALGKQVKAKRAKPPEPSTPRPTNKGP